MKNASHVIFWFVAILCVAGLFVSLALFFQNVVPEDQISGQSIINTKRKFPTVSVPGEKTAQTAPVTKTQDTPLSKSASTSITKTS